MGLKHQAIHAMLANPNLAPFEVIEPPSECQDWILIDHLMAIHRVKEDDYAENDPAASVLDMAKTLACNYAPEGLRARCVVLVKDGSGAQKPSVRALRSARTVAPHIDFCKKHLGKIEYAAMRLLAETGAEEFFLVTGAEWSNGETSADRRCELISFHADLAPDLTATKPHDDDDLVESSVCSGEIVRPPGVSGLFVSTFAAPASERAAALLAACRGCRSCEADTLLVELGNALEGSVTVCTGDSDLVAVLAVSGRHDLNLRLDNLSYRYDRPMHESTFGELLWESRDPENAPRRLDHSSPRVERFRALCEVPGDELPDSRKLHGDFERILEAHGGVPFRSKALDYLYRGGIRGSLYPVFLVRYLESEASLSGFEAELEKSHESSVSAVVRYAFETLCGKPMAATLGKKRPRSEDALETPDGEVSDGITSGRGKPTAATRGKTGCIVRMAKAYASGSVPGDSHARFIRLSRLGRYMFLRAKTASRLNDRACAERMFFMALCGTDYSVTQRGLGIKRLLTAAVTNQRLFSAWCERLEANLWRASDGEPPDFHGMGMELASLAGIPQKIRDSHWTAQKCELTFRTLKYVCDLWKLKGPRMGPEYGFYVHGGEARFVDDDRGRSTATHSNHP